jgi:hypothetical protein
MIMGHVYQWEKESKLFITSQTKKLSSIEGKPENPTLLTFPVNVILLPPSFFEIV